VLLDPVDEQLDLPATLVKGGSRQRWQRIVVDQEDDRLARLWILEANAPKMFGVSASA